MYYYVLTGIMLSLQQKLYNVIRKVSNAHCLHIAALCNSKYSFFKDKSTLCNPEYFRKMINENSVIIYSRSKLV